MHIKSNRISDKIGIINYGGILRKRRAEPGEKMKMGIIIRRVA